MQKKRWVKALMACVFVCMLVGGFSFKKDKNIKQTVSKQITTQSVDTNDLDGNKLYDSLNLYSKGLSFEVFKKAYHGFQQIAAKGMLQKPLLSIVDMSQPSCKKRLYIIDAVAKKLLVNTLVAHGRNSGDTKATKFSNTPESLQSSLGFYITGATYEGGNGFSMRLKGLEKGFNDLAESRAIVMHGAAYVTEEMAKTCGRIGRSWGCPAVSLKEHNAIINLVKNGSCLFVYAPEKKYLAQSAFLVEKNNKL